MARTKQKLINYHGSNAANLKAADLLKGEIAIAHGLEASATSIYTLDGNNALVEFASKATVEKMVQEGPEAKVLELSGATINLSGAVVSNASRISTLETDYLKKLNGSAKTDDYVKIVVSEKSGNMQDISIATTYGAFTLNPGTGKSLSGITASTQGVAKASDVATIAGRLIENDEILQGEIEATDASVEGLSGAVISNVDRLDALEALPATGITSTQIGNWDNEVGAKEAGKVLSGAVISFSAQVNANYATKQEVKDLSGKTVNEIVALSAKTDGINTRVSAAEAKLTGLKKDTVQEAIDDAVSSVYKFKGSCTYAELIAKTGMTNGDVWNVTDACTHEGKKYPAGTNFAWDATAGKWDALGGTIDLEPYATKAAFSAFSGSLITYVDALSAKTDGINTRVGLLEAKPATGITSTQIGNWDNEVGAKNAGKVLSGAVISFSAQVNANYATKQYVNDLSAHTVNEIVALSAKTDGINGRLETVEALPATGITSTQIGNWDNEVGAKEAGKVLSGAVISFSAQVNANYATKQYVNDLSAHTVNEIVALSGKTHTIVTDHASRIQILEGAKVTSAEALGCSGVTASFANHTVTYDFTNMIIDCGTF